MKKLKSLSILAVLLLLSAFPVIAGGKQETGEKAAAAPVKIQLAISPREVGKVIPSLINQFQQQNQGITVDWLKVPGVPNEQYTLVYFCPWVYG
ncbi:MAG: hypothetical protein DRP57_10350 [Spirochaetes bacterium]|nr:MAG: hypothetical protein DRP57_10350 [Spirochaetota bacterium]